MAPRNREQTESAPRGRGAERASERERNGTPPTYVSVSFCTSERAITIESGGGTELCERSSSVSVRFLASAGPSACAAEYAIPLSSPNALNERLSSVRPRVRRDSIRQGAG